MNTACQACPMTPKWGKPSFNPEDAIEGFPQSNIWIIGLNPKTKNDEHQVNGPNPIDWENPLRTSDEISKIPHFNRLKGPLGEKWNELLQKNGIAHTDLLKCGSPSFGNDEKTAVNSCFPILREQIKKYRPKLLVVFSVDASRKIAEQAKLDENATEGVWKHEGGEETYVLLSGYISPGRDKYSNLRLNRDFMSACETLGLTSS